jgi:hypothetical protein
MEERGSPGPPSETLTGPSRFVVMCDRTQDSVQAMSGSRLLEPDSKSQNNTGAGSGGIDGKRGASRTANDA